LQRERSVKGRANWLQGIKGEIVAEGKEYKREGKLVAANKGRGYSCRGKGV